ncbi:hypothetical protein ACHWQZ_G002708 [Mnemiopsis leidyi]
MTSMKEMLELYIKLDVLQLDAVLRRHRKEALSAHGLDPLHFYTAPGLTWEAGLKFTKVQLDLITDPDLHRFFEDSIRGGISTITTRYARADKRTDGYTQSTMKELV